MGEFHDLYKNMRSRTRNKDKATKYVSGPGMRSCRHDGNAAPQKLCCSS